MKKSRRSGLAVPPPHLGRMEVWWRHAVAIMPGLILALTVGIGAPLSALSVHPGRIMRWEWIVTAVVVAWFALGTAVGALLMRWRRKAPLAIAIILSQFSAVCPGAVGYAAWSTVSMCARRKWVEITLLAVCELLWPLTILAFFAEAWARDTKDISLLLAGILLVALSMAAYGLQVAYGFYIGARRALWASLTERAETAERERSLHALQARHFERARIAREMHDVVAHRISLVSMHSGVLAYRDDLTPEQTQEIARTINENSTLALTELRSVLTTLRSDGVALPQPTVSELEALIDESREAGVPLDATVTIVDEDSLAPNVARHLYRTVQEALTNVRKHAMGSPTTLRLTGAPGEGITLEVRNALGSSSSMPGSGLGLIGLTERAEISGGTFAAHHEQGDFVVRAWYPWEK